MQKATILIADDDKAILKILEFNLMKRGYKTVTSLTLSGAREIIQSGEVDVALLDVMFPEGLSTEILPDIVKSDNTFQVIMTTASKSVENAITAMKSGAYDYILKPFDFDRLFATIEHALDSVRAAKEIAQLKNNLLSKYQFENIIGDSEPMKELFHLMKQVLDVNATVLLQADSGTGKELVAKAIHYSSARKDNPFVDVNCAAIT
ncbi:MAG: sigma-54-dependent Fis family transcriptional regulator, partial [Candidatus Marinimicrobia bacterium]|nr:sigma-54-dependent Fis family transcriptional regulator [Candidatus Neomarinimicrobiota bacterium]